MYEYGHKFIKTTNLLKGKLCICGVHGYDQTDYIHGKPVNGARFNFSNDKLTHYPLRDVAVNPDM